MIHETNERAKNLRGVLTEARADRDRLREINRELVDALEAIRDDLLVDDDLDIEGCIQLADTVIKRSRGDHA